MLTVKNLYKSFGRKEVLHKINFEVKDNQIIGLLGPNGAGKTTAMRVITGFLSPSKGTVLINGINVADRPRETKAFLGYLPEDNPLYNFLTPYEYLEFMKAIKSPLEKERDREIKKIIKVCGLIEVARDKIDILSRGYKQRVGLAASLIANPSILILDEPTTGLDPNQRKEIKKLIKKLKKTTLFSSHVLSEVKDLCRQVIIINKGKVIVKGKISQLTKNKQTRLEITILIKPKEKREKAIRQIKESLEKKIKEEKLSFPRSKAGTVKAKIDRPKNTNQIRAIFWKLCQKNNWQLYELKETEQSLDEVFQKLTQNDH